MELNWTTFILEIVNFLILVWILKHFLYRPVLNIIARRRSSIEKQAAEAQQQLQQAKSLEAQYQSRLSDWEKERQKNRDALRVETEAERARQIDLLQRSLVEERAKAKRADEKQYDEIARQIEHQAMEQAAQFASRLLSKCASPGLEDSFLQLLVEDLRQLDEQQKKALFVASREQSTVDVTSAFPLSPQQKQVIEEGINEAAGSPVSFRYLQKPALLAGLLVASGSWTLRANLRDELKTFAEFAHATR